MEIILTFLLIMVKVMWIVCHPFFVYFTKGKRKIVPPVRNELLLLSAGELAEKIRKKQVTSEETVKAYIDRVEEVNPLVNAVVEDRFRQALKEARAVDNYVRTCSLNEEELEKTKPLLGVPVTIKESCGVKGLEYSVGCLSRKGYKAEADGESVARLRSNGAIVLLVSSTPELCLSYECANLVTGTTNNPYDTTCTSGGSSGGEAALIASAASVIGLGSDVAGSIRTPAAYCGIFGHKPTRRTVSIRGHYPSSDDEKFNDYFVIGPLTRYAKDLRLVMNALVEPMLKQRLKLNEKIDLKTLRIFYMVDVGNWSYCTTEEDIQNAVIKAVKHLEYGCGAKVEERKFPELRDIVNVLASALFSLKNIPSPFKEDKDSVVLELVKSLAGYSKISPSTCHTHLMKKAINSLVDDHSVDTLKWTKTFAEALGDDGIFIFPTATFTAPKHSEFLLNITGNVYALPANVLGLPCTNVPCGLNKDGMPIGVQIIAGHYQDRVCLSVAEELEKYFGGWLPPNKA